MGQLADMLVKYQQLVIGVEVVLEHRIKDSGIIDGTPIEDTFITSKTSSKS